MASDYEKIAAADRMSIHIAPEDDLGEYENMPQDKETLSDFLQQATDVLGDAITKENIDVIQRVLDYLTLHARKNISFMKPITEHYVHLIHYYPALLPVINKKTGQPYSYSTTNPEFSATVDHPSCHVAVQPKPKNFGSRWSLDYGWLRHKRHLRTHVWCVVPLVGLSRFPPRNIFFPESIFTDIAMRGQVEGFELPFWLPIIEFKWKTFARPRYYIYLIQHMFNYILFMVAAAPTIGQNDPLEWRREMFFACIILSTWLFILELRLLIHMRLNYFLSFYKLLNGAAVVMPWIISLNGIVNNARGPSRFTAFTILILWANFLQQCRIYRTIGLFANVIISVVWSLRSFMLIMLVIVLGFSHALWTALADISVPGGPNHYNTFPNSIKYTYYWLTGDTSAIGTFDGVDLAADVFRVLFSLITVIILLNLLIAMLNDSFNKATEISEKSYLLQLAQVLADVEIFFLLPSERKKIWFADELYFEVNMSRIKQWNKKLGDDDKQPENWRDIIYY
ncbi:hypothetical protein BC937DRAFT_92039 [Endogone sp. FLAS-F59071]|nr:hypothetical protein BC937DRAFT_92039 [Endogone sp. FLAS-F59071]|eukprot:RUS21628.1 hypothetical protein BC937DRAFT_92039 [Endogone sp. FLAS-F59071]